MILTCRHLVSFATSLAVRRNMASLTVPLFRAPYLNRSPVKVKFPDGEWQDRKSAQESLRGGHDPVFPDDPTLKEETRAEDLHTFELSDDSVGTEPVLRNLKYKKLELNDSLFRQMMMNSKASKKRRLKQGMKDKYDVFMVEGSRLLRDAIEVGLEPQAVFFSRESDLKSCFTHCPPVIEEIMEGKIYKVPYKTMQTWSDVASSPGILGVFLRKEVNKVLEDMENSQEIKEFTVIMDNVRDPGNMGSMLRSCAAAGCRRVILTKGCVDAWNPKVVRGGMGSHFRLPLIDDATWEQIRSTIPRDSQIFVADAESADTVPYRSVSSIVDKDASLKGNSHAVLIIGGETEGLSPEAYGLVAEFEDCKRIHVPLARGMESLNVNAAFSVLVFHISGLME